MHPALQLTIDKMKMETSNMKLEKMTRLLTDHKKEELLFKCYHNKKLNRIKNQSEH